ncbi:putative endonuclease-reverse transcriptase, partial [Operophtera brumata]
MVIAQFYNYTLYNCGDKVFKYLGNFLSDDVNVERERRALASPLLARRFSRYTDQVKVTLSKAYGQSYYKGSLWVRHTKISLGALRIQYNNIFRMMMGLPRFCSASEMFA